MFSIERWYSPKSVFGRRDRSRRRAQRSRGKQALQFGFEGLEHRVLPSTYTVTSTLYSATTSGTLAYEIDAAITANDGSAHIGFSLPDNSTIALNSSDVSATTTYGPTAYVVSGSSVKITIDGSGASGLTIDGGSAVRLFAVTSTASLALENLTLSGGLAQGDGGDGPGGGGDAGLGGAVYVDGGTFTSYAVTFNNNAAAGGAGATGASNGGGANGDFGEGGVGGAGGDGGDGGFGGGGGGAGAGAYEPGFGGFGGGIGGGTGGGGGGGAGLGGAIFSNGGSITLVNDTFTSDTATGGAGGSGELNGGAGSGYGGAVFALNGSVAATFVTSSANTAVDGNGDALDGTDLFVLSDLTDSGINGNGTVSAALTDDILGQVTATSSDFVADSTASGSPPSLSGGYDLISNNGPTISDSTGFIGPNVISGDPELDVLGNNGGFTQTMAARADSPTIGAGVAANDPITNAAITTDQAGGIRTNPPDLGALNQTAVATITVSETSLDLGSTDLSLAGTVYSYTVGGSSLTAGILITAPTGVELYDDGSSPLPNSLTLLTLPETDGIVSASIEARISASATGGYFTGTITNTSTGATEQDVAVSGTVNKAQSMGSDVDSSAPQTSYGQDVTFSVTFSANSDGSYPMTGTVAFYDGNTYLGMAPLISPALTGFRYTNPFPGFLGIVFGTANFTTTSLGAGDNVINAVYSGDSNYSPATSEASISVNVAPATTSTTLIASTTPQGTTLTATVVATSPGNPPIVGIVSFYDGTTLLGVAPVSSGVATLTVGTLSAGTHPFSAVFSGGGNVSTSQAALDVSTNAPQVTSVSRYGFHAQRTYLLVNFNDALDPISAQSNANYEIIGPGGHRIEVVAARYDSATHSVTLNPARRLNVHWRYKLVVTGTLPSGLTDPSGIPLDGAGNGLAGSNYVTSITWRNLAGRASQLPTLGLLDTNARGLVVRKPSSHQFFELSMCSVVENAFLATRRWSLYRRCH